ncbi:MAG TPA: hypothetical protein VLA56_12170 [Pseudomonadales bacterium]|nr:hypothetical protein [Pseudomonadales bacterium]
MTTRFRCCACGRRFGEQEALCEDWSDPEKSFICPGCGSYLRRADTAGFRVIEGRGAVQRLRRWLPLVPMAAAVLLAAVLLDGIWGDRGALAALLIGGAVLVFMALRRAEEMAPEETVRVEDLGGAGDAGRADPRQIH